MCTRKIMVNYVPNPSGHTGMMLCEVTLLVLHILRLEYKVASVSKRLLLQ